MPLILNGTTGVSGVDGSAGTPSYQGNDTNTGIFYPAADTIAFAEGGAEIARFDSSGNFGINTTSPGVKLGVVDTSAGTITFPAIFGNRGTTNSTEVFFGLQTYDSGGAGITNGISSVTTSNTSSAGSADLKFWTTNSATRAERMRIDSSGNVLVGTSSLNRLGSGASGTAFQLAASGTPEIYISTASVNSGDFVGTINFGTTGTSSATKRSALIGSTLTAASGTNVSGDLQFYTNSAGTLAERMRITSTGQLGLGVTPSAWGGGFKALQIGRGSYSADGTSNLQVSMNAYYDGSNWRYISANRAANMYLDLGGGIYTRTTNIVGTVDGAISWIDGPYVAAAGTSWTNASDENLKNITGEITDAVSKVQSLRAAEFTWKADTENKPQVGLIAQDLQKVLPECVVVPDEKIDSQGNPKFLGVNYDQVIPLLVAAIKEQQAMIEELKAKVAALEAK